MSCIVGEKQIEALLMRYNGIGKPISNDEREILLFALYNESEARGGIAATAKAACDRVWMRQQIVGTEEPVVAQPCNAWTERRLALPGRSALPLCDRGRDGRCGDFGLDRG